MGSSHASRVTILQAPTPDQPTTHPAITVITAQAGIAYKLGATGKLPGTVR